MSKSIFRVIPRNQLTIYLWRGTARPSGKTAASSNSNSNKCTCSAPIQ